MTRQRGPWLPGLLLVTAILLLALSGSGVLEPLESILSYIVAPIEHGIAGLLKTLGELTQTSRDLRELQQKVETLQQDNDALVQENIRLRQYQAENEELRTQLYFARENPTYSLIGADVIGGRVVGNDTNPYLRYLIINAGTRDGVAVGMPVVTGGSALVGRIARTSPNLAYVQLINDPQSEIAAMLQQQRVTGMVIGTADGGLLMTEILPDEEVNEGETVITSAIGGLLPRGLILGQLATITYQESDLFQKATIRPAVDFRRLETVLVIIDFPRPNLDELEPAP